jgi:hypothetical protein
VTLALVLALLSHVPTVSQRRFAEVGLLVLIVLDLVIATGEFGYLRQVPVGLSNRYASTDRRTALPAGFFEAERDAAGLGRLELFEYRPRIASAPSDGGYRASCYEPLVPAQWALLEQRLSRKPATGATLYDLDPERHATFYDVAGVVRILEQRIEGSHEVVINEDALPRAYLVNRFRVVPQARAFRHIRVGDVDFRAEVLLEEDPALLGIGFPWAELEPAEIVSYAPERVEIEAQSPGVALLVLSDTHFPGWRATVNGEPAEILRANGLYRAVRVGRGRQRVVFEYVPESLRVGGALSLGSLLSLSAVGVVAWRRRRVARGGGAAR